uniref:Uncharacterized protein n=1 Tax=Oryza sativa subsp. japonica TaxID=39947 RepID=Q6Z364_ORYSJ|nr:hypothetical protein [Oryza sativa Japonica Group]
MGFASCSVMAPVGLAYGHHHCQRGQPPPDLPLYRLAQLAAAHAINRFRPSILPKWRRISYACNAYSC